MREIRKSGSMRGRWKRSHGRNEAPACCESSRKQQLLGPTATAPAPYSTGLGRGTASLLSERIGSLAVSSGRDSPSSGRCKVLPRAITRSSLAWDRRRGATCVLGVIRQIIHAPARDERRACGPYQKGTRSGVVKTPGQSTGQPGRGMAEPPHCRRRQQRSRISSTSRDRHPRRRQRRHAGKVM